MKNTYEYEVRFYLISIVYEKYLKKSKYILLDLYKDAIGKIYIKYMEYEKDNKNNAYNVPLIESIECFLASNKDFVNNALMDCVEY